eukprot:6041807-Pleurochrysis_carterae.AAC.1
MLTAVAARYITLTAAAAAKETPLLKNHLWYASAAVATTIATVRRTSMYHPGPARPQPADTATSTAAFAASSIFSARLQ